MIQRYRISRLNKVEIDGKVTVYFPNFDSKTFGESYNDAVEMGVDLLAMLLATNKIIPVRFVRNVLLQDYSDPKFEVVPVFVDETLVKEYTTDKKAKCNTSFYQSVLNKIDEFLPSSRFTNRSQFLENAALYFIEFEKKFLDLNKSVFSELSIVSKILHDPANSLAPCFFCHGQKKRRDFKR